MIAAGTVNLMVLDNIAVGSDSWGLNGILGRGFVVGRGVGGFRVCSSVSMCNLLCIHIVVPVRYLEKSKSALPLGRLAQNRFLAVTLRVVELFAPRFERRRSAMRPRGLTRRQKFDRRLFEL